MRFLKEVPVVEADNNLTSFLVASFLHLTSVYFRPRGNVSVALKVVWNKDKSAQKETFLIKTILGTEHNQHQVSFLPNCVEIPGKTKLISSGVSPPRCC